MKTVELTGADLDYWVAKAEDSPCLTYHGGAPIPFQEWVDGQGYRPSSNWAHGGPIIERERIEIDYAHDTAMEGGEGYCAFILDIERPVEGYRDVYQAKVKRFGKTHLIAAMRAYVASKYGDEVPDESQSGVNPKS